MPSLYHTIPLLVLHYVFVLNTNNLYYLDPPLQKQFRQQPIRRAPEQNNECSSQIAASGFIDDTPVSVPDSSQKELAPQYQHEKSSADEKRKSVHERIRVPVSYDDLLGDDLKNDEA